jgi:hypothetical protein
MSTVFGALERWRQTPIPDQAPVRARRAGCRALPINSAFVHFTEPLVDLLDYDIAGENYYWSERNPPYWRRAPGSIPNLWLRQSVAQKLVAVNASLAEAGLALFVFDAWRPRAVQAYFHDVWMPAQLAKFRADLAGDALTSEVERYWAAPTTSAESPAPHPLDRRRSALDGLAVRRCHGDRPSRPFRNQDRRDVLLRRRGAREPPAPALGDGRARIFGPRRRMVALLLGRPDVGVGCRRSGGALRRGGGGGEWGVVSRQ